MSEPNQSMGPLAPPPRSLPARLRAWFLSGVLVIAPLAITFWVAAWFVDLVDNRVLPGRLIPYPVPGLGVIVTFAAITLIGWATSGFVGRFVHRTSEDMVNRIPVIRAIYGSTKQIFQSVLAERSSAFRQVAIFEYPRRGTWSIGFLTGATSGEVQEKTQRETVNVFVPTTPNPTSGYLLFVPRDDLILLDMTIEEGIKMVVSGGIVTPPWTPEAKLPQSPAPGNSSDA
jgi:uncharacterized membrane protein